MMHYYVNLIILLTNFIFCGKLMFFLKCQTELTVFSLMEETSPLLLDLSGGI